MAMKSSEYWKKREAENAMKNQISEVQYKKDIEEIYANMMDEINKEINGFYTKYAAKEGITMAEAKKRVSKLDIAAYERKAKKYVETKDFSDRANEEMRIYNLTMKVNRLELLKANIGLEMVSGFDEMQKYFDKKLTDRTLKEFQRQAGILGKSALKNEKYAHAIVNASFKNATYSDRIWMYQGMLKAELEGLLASGLIRGQNPKKLAKHLEKRFGVSAYNAQRLMTTELARVQTEAQKQSFIRNGFDEYVYVACTKGDVCPICKGLDDKHFKVDDMMPGENAPPMHPNCHCSTAAYMDNEAYEEWINSYQEHGLNFEDWQSSMESEKLVDKLSKYEKDFEKLTEGYSYDEFVNDFGSVEEGFDGSDANEIKKAKVDESYVVALASSGQFMIFSEGGMGTILKDDMGLKQPANMPEQDSITLPTVSIEGLSEIDADNIVVIGMESDKQDLAKNSVFNEIRAVKDGNYTFLNASPFFSQAYNPMGRKLLLEEVKNALM